MERNRKNILHYLLLLLLIATVQVSFAQEMPSVQTVETPLVEEADTCAPCIEMRKGVMRCPTHWALKSNLLFDAILVPNIGIEVTLCKQMTLAFDWYHTWFKSDSRHRYWQCYGGYLTLRHYLRKNVNVDNDLTGHHIGAYVSMLTYDVEWGGKGYQASTPGFGFGLEYGYGTPLNRRLRLDFNIGIGYYGDEYKKYEPANDNTGHYVWLSTNKRNWWGPTKAEVSLKWIIGRMPQSGKKGGKR